jgi:hypothetical protein
MKALTPEQIAQISSKPTREKVATYTVPGTNVKRRMPDTSVRDLMTWLKLPHRLGRICAFSKDGDEHRHFTAEVEGINMCRHCFLEGKGPGDLNLPKL